MLKSKIGLFKTHCAESLDDIIISDI